MPKAQHLSREDIATRLRAIKLMVAGMKDLLPNAAREHRRLTCETIDDLIQEVVR